MKQRLLTALVGVSVAIAWLFTIYTPAFAIILAVIAVIGEFEMLRVFEVKNVPFKVLCLIMTAGIMIYPDYSDKLHVPMFPAVTAVVLVSLIIMVLDFEKLRFEQVVCSLFAGALIPASLSCVVLFRDVYKTFPAIFIKSDGIFFILFAFFCSWMTDGCALFAGKAFGKHKLAEKVSPKKTVEGLVGGLLTSVIICLAAAYVYETWISPETTVNLLLLAAVTLCGAVLSVFGDLLASLIKRQSGIKDFGNLMPGHGGVMDRFDSLLLTAPLVVLAVTQLPIFGA